MKVADETILVLADDFSGSAEIAGIGVRFGLPTALLRAPLTTLASGLTVIDCNSRKLDNASAAEVVRKTVASIAIPHHALVYKKTDSVLRGPVAAEIDAMRETLGKDVALLASANPSRGRTIRDGRYFVDNVELHQTAFRDDPDHPAASSQVRKMIKDHPKITSPDITTADDLFRIASTLTDSTLPAGAAEFFSAILLQRGYTLPDRFPEQSGPSEYLRPGVCRLFINGSVAPYSSELRKLARQHHFQIQPLLDSPLSIQLLSGPDVLLHIAPPIDRTKAAAFESALVETAALFIDAHHPATVFVDGGATAAALCHRMNWSAFTVERELAPGVVAFKVDNSSNPPLLLVKPGSYAWPRWVFDR